MAASWSAVTASFNGGIMCQPSERIFSNACSFATTGFPARRGPIPPLAFAP